MVEVGGWEKDKSDFMEQVGNKGRGEGVKLETLRSGSKGELGEKRKNRLRLWATG